MNETSFLEKLHQAKLTRIDKQRRLEEKLTKRPDCPQERDIFMFDYPETIDFEWVILRQDTKNPDFFLTIPADDNPMVGSADVDLPDSALCSPLTLRCQHGLLVHKDTFNIEQRIGLLEKWHWYRALNQVEQINKGKLNRSVLQEITDDDSEYEEWISFVSKQCEELKKKLENIEIQQQQSGFKAEGTVTTSKKTVKISWLNSIFDTLKTAFFGARWQVGWATASVFVFVVSLTVFWYSPNNAIDLPNNSISPIYQTILANKKTPEMEGWLRDFKFPWEGGKTENVLGLTPTISPYLAQKAFGAGLLVSRNGLLRKPITLPPLLLPPEDKKSWLQTKWASNFELGQWMFLLWTTSQFQPDMPKTFWDEQRVILMQLKGKFETQQTKKIRAAEARKVIYQLEKFVEPLLEKLPTSDRLEVNSEIADLKETIEFLAPN